LTTVQPLRQKYLQRNEKNDRENENFDIENEVFDRTERKKELICGS
jgi:hypothetical protein